MVATRGPKHEHLGMTLNYSEPDVTQINVNRYIDQMVKEIPLELKETVATPANANLFEVFKVKKLAEEDKQLFHTFVAKALYACKRARPDILPTVSYLCIRVKEPNVADMAKLKRMMLYLKIKPHDNLRLTAEHVTVTSADAAFAVHEDFKSHSGVTVSLGKGAFHSESSKQKLNTRSSTEAETVAADTAMTHVLWTKWFLKGQGYTVTFNVLEQDNQAAIKLEENGKFSSGKRTRHINIEYFFIADQMEKKHVRVKYCPTDELMADFMSKPLQGAKFLKFKHLTMNLSGKPDSLKEDPAPPVDKRPVISFMLQ